MAVIGLSTLSINFSMHPLQKGQPFGAWLLDGGAYSMTQATQGISFGARQWWVRVLGLVVAVSVSKPLT